VKLDAGASRGFANLKIILGKYQIPVIEAFVHEIGFNAGKGWQDPADVRPLTLCSASIIRSHRSEAYHSPQLQMSSPPNIGRRHMRQSEWATSLLKQGTS